MASYHSGVKGLDSKARGCMISPMTALQRIQQISALIGKYAPLAVAAVAQVQAEVGASNGDTKIQQSKKALAVTYIIAAAHAGESLPNSTVQQISGIVDLVAGTAKALGLGGKTGGASGSVSVPAAPTA
jgi:hypothetical protein